MRGLKEREWGAKGVRQMHSTVDPTIEPPADRLYAVDPVGEEMTNLENYSPELPIPDQSCEELVVYEDLQRCRVGRETPVDHNLV